MIKKGEAEKAGAKPDTCDGCRYCVVCACGDSVLGECHGMPPSMPRFQHFIAYHVGPTVERGRPACSLFERRTA
jgi:hypothetical protein